MSTEITTGNPLQDFQNKVIEKLKLDIGAMLPDAVLAGLVEKAVSEQFFQKRIISEGSYSKKEIPSWFVEEVGKHAKPLIETMLKEWVASNQDTLKAAITEFTSNQNLLLLSFAAIRSSTFQDINELASLVSQRLKQGY